MAETIYVSQGTFEDRGSSVLVVACSSGSTLPYVREFLDKGLKLPDGAYNLLAVPGGPQFLALSEYLPKFGWVGQKWLGFAVDKLKVRRIILIAHQDCQWYADERFAAALLNRLGHGERTTRERQIGDLKETVSSLRAALPMTAPEAYFAGKSADGHLAFTREA